MALGPSHSGYSINIRWIKGKEDLRISMSFYFSDLITEQIQETLSTPLFE